MGMQMNQRRTLHVHLASMTISLRRRPRVALVVFTSTQDIETLLDSEAVMNQMTIQDKVIYRLDFDARKDGWMIDVFGRL
jgi:hypothetical protein